jgi:hypothetical protein
MSAKKLSRLAGFALVLAAVFGGVGAASAVNTAGGPAGTSTTSSAVAGLQLQDIVWV